MNTPTGHHVPDDARLCPGCAIHVLKPEQELCPACTRKQKELNPDCPIRMIVFVKHSKLWPCSKTSCAWYSKAGQCCTFTNLEELISTLKHGFSSIERKLTNDKES